MMPQHHEDGDDTDAMLARLAPPPQALAMVARPFTVSAAALRELAQPDAPAPPALAGAVLKRQVEFAAGRWCAARALRRSGYRGPPAIGVGAQRAPCWPAGYLGSISHSKGWAVAITAASDTLSGVGIDLEHCMDDRTARSVGAHIGNAAEMAVGAAAGLAFETWTTLLFSAKESLFKALYPSVGRYFHFPDAAAESLDREGRVLHLRLTTTLTPRHHAGARYAIDFALGRQRLVTRCLVAA
ncbi:4'-phosphopantetheinyl transferase family protein [Janthinobacterium fluminis]|uniref:Enterobactin synthase component D n=1 Tax=Janthinobacterium fluminis TaxID=2987524 RepID=A0ABT5K006_9BURK|nr:4'-phosphopantetheinyl transferase superfamily protein [Janthinobacterium fluminis]MDC8758061.1 4'-phosphopantetheinyl transferase superfamily protein [Janthinobacterium fluminis]